jgi:thioredoxin-related protein
MIAALMMFMLADAQAATGKGDQPLHDAVKKGDLVALQAAVASAANLNAKDKDGRTALMFAAEAGNGEALKLLIDAGASMDINDFLGMVALHYAVEAPLEITRTLIKSGADVDIRNSGGITPLMMAAGAGRRDIVKQLLAAGARVDFKDYQGNSVTDWAKRSKDDGLVAMLEGRIKSLAVVEKKTNQGGENFAEDVFVDVHFPQWFKPSFLNFQDDVAEATGSGKQGILLFLSTRRCSYCKAFIDNVFSQPEIRQRIENSFDVYGLEIFDKSEMVDPTGKQYRVNEFVSAIKASFTPTLLFYGGNGEQLVKIVGYYPPEKFTRVLDYLDGRHYQNEPLRTYMARTAPAPATSKQEIIADNELFTRPPYMLDRSAFSAQNPLVVIFEKPGCDSCELFHKRVLSDKSVRRLMGEYESVQLDATDTKTRVKTPDGKVMSPAEWYEKLELSYSPAIVFFDQQGKEAIRLDSETQRFRMEGTLQLVLAGGHKDDAQLQRWRWKKAVQVFNQQAE